MHGAIGSMTTASAERCALSWSGGKDSAPTAADGLLLSGILTRAHERGLAHAGELAAGEEEPRSLSA
jgi:hypothetical protein